MFLDMERIVFYLFCYLHILSFVLRNNILSSLSRHFLRLLLTKECVSCQNLWYHPSVHVRACICACACQRVPVCVCFEKHQCSNISDVCTLNFIKFFCLSVTKGSRSKCP